MHSSEVFQWHWHTRKRGRTWVHQCVFSSSSLTSL